MGSPRVRRQGRAERQGALRHPDDSLIESRGRARTQQDARRRRGRDGGQMRHRRRVADGVIRVRPPRLLTEDRAREARLHHARPHSSARRGSADQGHGGNARQVLRSAPSRGRASARSCTRNDPADSRDPPASSATGREMGMARYQPGCQRVTAAHSVHVGQAAIAREDRDPRPGVGRTATGTPVARAVQLCDHALTGRSMRRPDRSPRRRTVPESQDLPLARQSSPLTRDRHRSRRPRDQVGLRRARNRERHLITHLDNQASQRVAQRFGYHREGVLRAWAPTRDDQPDVVMWSRRASDPTGIPTAHDGPSSTIAE